MPKALTDIAREKQLAEQAVKDINRQYPDNKDYAASTFLRKGAITIYKVHFTNKDGSEEYDNWAVVKRDDAKAYYFLDTLMIDRDNGLFESEKFDQDFLKIIIVSVLAFVFSGAVIWIVITHPENTSLQVLTGLAGLTIGFLVGQSKATTP